MKKQNPIAVKILVILLAIGLVIASVLFLAQRGEEKEWGNKYNEIIEVEDSDNGEKDSSSKKDTDKEELEDIPIKSHPIVASARNQIGVTVEYDPSYVVLDYPLGDVSIKKGTCTDVVIRALRDAYSMDLQVLVHEDMKNAFSEYPNKWGLQGPDKNIDHRRVLNLKTYFDRKGYSVNTTNNPDNYLPGDIVTCRIPGNLPHIMIVSDKKTERGVPFIIHNIGAGTKEEDRLFEFRITGHYRIKDLE